MIRRVNTSIAEDRLYSQDADKAIAFIIFVDKILGVLPPEEEKPLPPELLKKIEEREKARQAKNYELADRIRKELLKEGIILEDTKDGVRWKKKHLQIRDD
jgi:cysteinyl-tRNA synthetase